MKTKEKKEKNPIKKKIKRILMLIVVVIIIIVVATVALKIAVMPRRNAEIITTASIKKMIDIEELSTIEVRYDGVAINYNEKNPENVEYYVAYTGTVKIGFNLDEVMVEVNEDEKEVIIELPEMKITEANIDESSIDYIFIKRSSKKDINVSNEAVALCRADIETESAEQEALINLARDNAKNTMLALTEPFVTQLNEEYTVIVR